MFENSKYSVVITIAIACTAIILFVYLMWYMSPSEVTEKVKIIANTADGCIAESYDGFSVNIGPCNAKPGEIIVGTYDAKIKERELLMNPSR